MQALALVGGRCITTAPSLCHTCPLIAKEEGVCAPKCLGNVVVLRPSHLEHLEEMYCSRSPHHNCGRLAHLDQTICVESYPPAEIRQNIAAASPPPLADVLSVLASLSRHVGGVSRGMVLYIYLASALHAQDVLLQGINPCITRTLESM